MYKDFQISRAWSMTGQCSVFFPPLPRETGFHSIGRAGLKILILTPPPPEHWNRGRIPSHGDSLYAFPAFKVGASN